MLTLKFKFVCDRCGTSVADQPILVHIDERNVMRLVNLRESMPYCWTRTKDGDYLCSECE